MTKIWRLQCIVQDEDVALAEDILFPHAVAMEDEKRDDGSSQLTFLMQAEPQRGFLDQLPFATTVTTLEDEDWLAKGARGATQAGPFTLLPLSDAANATADSILIDGRHAFGDGHHPTTIGCIIAMNSLSAAKIMPKFIADIGCGTGILALAAAKLWPDAKVTASDCDEAAVKATQAAAKANHLNLKILQASGYEGHYQSYDLIVMNLLLQPLLALAAETAQNLAPVGCCILSGILPEQAETVAAAYEAQGLFELPQTSHDGWMILMFRKP